MRVLREDGLHGHIADVVERHGGVTRSEPALWRHARAPIPEPPGRVGQHAFEAVWGGGEVHRIQYVKAIGVQCP